MKNLEIAKIFYLMAEFIEMDKASFISIAYNRASRILESLENDIEEIYKKGGVEELKKISGVGKGIAEKIEEYIVNLVEASRNPKAYKMDIGNMIQYGASPRASIYLAMASKANALIEGRGYVTPQDVKSIAMDVLRHRVIITYEAEAEEKTSEDIIEQILKTVDVP